MDKSPWTKRGQKRKTERKKDSQTEVQESLKFGEKPYFIDYLLASSTATAQATVAPTIGLLPFRVKEFSGFLQSNKKARKP